MGEELGGVKVILVERRSTAQHSAAVIVPVVDS